MGSVFSWAFFLGVALLAIGGRFNLAWAIIGGFVVPIVLLFGYSVWQLYLIVSRSGDGS